MSTQSTQDQVSKEIVAHDLRAALEGKIDQEKIDAIVASVMKPAAAYGANVVVGGFLFWVHVAADLPGTPGAKSFSGDAGGIFTPGVGGSGGTLFTNDLNGLFDNTTGFHITLSGSYCAIFFYDDASNLLGNFQGAAAGIVVGTGGGRGNWS